MGSKGGSGGAGSWRLLGPQIGTNDCSFVSEYQLRGGSPPGHKTTHTSAAIEHRRRRRKGQSLAATKAMRLLLLFRTVLVVVVSVLSMLTWPPDPLPPLPLCLFRAPSFRAGPTRALDVGPIRFPKWDLSGEINLDVSVNLLVSISPQSRSRALESPQIRAGRWVWRRGLVGVAGPQVVARRRSGADDLKTATSKCVRRF